MDADQLLEVLQSLFDRQRGVLDVVNDHIRENLLRFELLLVAEAGVSSRFLLDVKVLGPLDRLRVCLERRRVRERLTIRILPLDVVNGAPRG